MSKKIYYGVKRLQPNQIRATEHEALLKHMVRYWGKHAVNKDLLKEYLTKPKKNEMTIEKARNLYIKYNAMKNPRSIISSKIKHAKTEKERKKYENQLNKAKEKANKAIEFLKSQK
jgi:hypothetical protein